MKLHWSPRSRFVRKAMVAAHEFGLAERMDCVRSVAAMTRVNPDIMADNPLGKIPTLVTETGEPIFDSGVIIEYLDALAGGGRLLPSSGPARWTALTRHALADGLLDLLILWRNERDKPQARQTPEWLAAFAAKVAATLDRMERDTPVLAVEPVGIAAIGTGVALSCADFRFPELRWRDGRPALARWHEGFAARPSMAATEVVDD